MSDRRSLDDLLAIMARLRDPDRGCPWDVAQDFASVAPHTLEEAYEVVDAIDRGDFDDLRDELGDLLLQVVFHAQMAAEAGHFAFADVVEAIADKLVRRHPHVFGGEHYESAQAQAAGWEQIKAVERAARGEAVDASALAGVSTGLPEWRRATKLQQRAARAGFEWSATAPVLDKLDEELEELRVECEAGAAPERIEDELGDLLFVAVNLARQTGTDFSRALRRANAKFERRFRRMEAIAGAEGLPLDQRDLRAQEQFWQRAKREERADAARSQAQAGGV